MWNGEAHRMEKIGCLKPWQFGLDLFRQEEPVMAAYWSEVKRQKQPNSC